MSKRHDPPQQESTDDERCIDTRAAAAILGLSPITLHQWRLRGTGPAFRRYGRQVRYQLGDLRQYMDAAKVGGDR